MCLVGQEARAGLCWQQTAAKAPFILPGYPLDSTWCQQWPSHVVIWHRSRRSCVHVPCMPIRNLKEPEVVLPGLELKLSWLAVQTLGHKLSTLMMYLKWSDIPPRLIFCKSDCCIFSFNQHEKCILTEGKLVSGLLVGQTPKQTWPARLISKSDRISTYNFPFRPTSPSPLLYKIIKSLAYLNSYLCPPSSVYHQSFFAVPESE